jgi:hypothetical protein
MKNILLITFLFVTNFSIAIEKSETKLIKINTLRFIPPPTITLSILPDCLVSTGSFHISDLPAGSWTLTMIYGASTTNLNGSGNSTTISGLALGTYFFYVSDGTFQSPFAAAFMSPSITTTWNGSSWSNGFPGTTNAAIINGNYSTFELL